MLFLTVSKLKVVEVVTGLGMGGAEKALLSRLKFQTDSFESFIFNHRMKLDELALPKNILGSSSDSNFLQLFFRFRELSRRYEPDLVIVRTPIDAIRFALIKSILVTSKWKLVFEAHSNFVSTSKKYSFLIHSLLRLSRSKIDLFVAVSDNVRIGPLCESNVRSHTVYLGSDVSLDRLKFIPSAQPRLLYLGRLAEVKRPMVLLKAIQELSHSQILPLNFLTIVGDGPLKSEVLDFIARGNLDDYVNFAGFQLDVSDYLKHSTHLISCSVNEGLPISFFEAKLAGLRIIATPSGGGSEIFDEFDFELPSFEVDDLVSHLKTILNEKVSSESRELIAKNSLWMKTESCSKKYYDLLRSLADR